MARSHGVDMPIANCVEAILEGALDVPGAVSALLARPQREEE
jgi:glycerol-3-phosphate dehydrogenase